MALNINGTTGISGVDGSNSAPAVTGTDSNTGINFGADIIDLNTAGASRFKIGAAGQLGIAGANYGTAGQALLSQGASAAPQWGAVASGSPSENYAFANMSTTAFDNSGYQVHGIGGSAGSNGVTVDTTNERLTPTVAGIYYVVYNVVWSHSGFSGFTAYNGIYKNGSQQQRTTIAIYDSDGTKTNTVFGHVSVNGSSDYIDFRSYHNKSGQNASCTNLSRAFMFKLKDN